MFTDTQFTDILIQTMRMKFTSDEYARICLIDKMIDLISAIKSDPTSSTVSAPAPSTAQHRLRLLLSIDPVYCLSTGLVYCLSTCPASVIHTTSISAMNIQRRKKSKEIENIEVNFR
jgi:hypothetical protein